MIIAAFFFGHYYLSLFSQTFFIHRYGSHRMFTMSKPWERFFHLLTYLSQGVSFLNPRAFALMHRMHHAYSDTPKDPHSPTQHPSVVKMMLATYRRFRDIGHNVEVVEKRFEGGYPEWPMIDRLADHPLSMAFWALSYAAFYYYFATATWQYLLVPVHCVMGPLHGGIVNWCGHRHGYRNFELKDVSHNTLVWDIVGMGELFQNNHHSNCMNPNFAARWYEIDPTYPIVKILAAFGVIQLLDPEVTDAATPADERTWGVALDA